MKFVFFTRHETLGASTRYRSLQHFDRLRAEGHEVVQYHFFSDHYLQARAAGRWPIIEIGHCFASRFHDALFGAKNADVIFIEKELFPYLPAATEKLLRTNSKIRVYDYDDAIWHSYEKRRFGPLGAVFANKISNVLQYGTHVVAGSRYLKHHLDSWGKTEATLVPTTVSSDRYTGQGLTAKKQVDIGWIGSMSTSVHVLEIFPVLERLYKSRGSKTRLIGFSERVLNGKIPDFLDIQPWSYSTELDLLAEARIGIMPLPDEPFERGKCGFKLAQYMGLGMPSVANPVGENRYIVQDGTTGYLADTQDDWFEKLSLLLDRPELAQRLGQTSYEQFKSCYCTEVTHQILRSAVWEAA